MIVARDAEGRPFSDAVICGNAMTMFFAGEDPDRICADVAVHHLCDAPDAAARLRAEADAQSPEEIARDFETANQLTFAGAVANETMRLRPVAPVLLFEALRDVVLDDVAACPKGIWVATLTRPRRWTTSTLLMRQHSGPNGGSAPPTGNTAPTIPRRTSRLDRDRGFAPAARWRFSR